MLMPFSRANITLYLTLLVYANLSVHALSLSRSYEHGPISFDSNGDLYFTVDKQSRTAYLAVMINDSDIVKSSLNWLGLGISEPSSGSMLGADVVTAEFSAGQIDSCTIKDRYVPFYAYPLIESVGNASSAFPLEDDCQDDGSWRLISCMRSEDDGQMILEVSRPLIAHDTQDRDIPPGSNRVIYAYGRTFQYHGSRRRSIPVTLYEEQETGAIGLNEDAPIPKDVDGSLDVTATAYEVPSNQVTTYACTSKLVRLKPGEQRMVVAAEPVFNSTNVDMVHHFTFWLCKGREYADLIKSTAECSTGNSKISGPLGNRKALCTTFVYGYAKGGRRLVLPPEAGMLMDNENNIFVMETHFDNPDRIPGNIDSSGIRVYYTKSLRKFEAGSLLLGDMTVARVGQTVRHGFEYEHSCTSACTRKFSRPINIYASGLHMHTTGMEIYENKFSENGTFMETINKINFWSDSFQGYYSFDPPKVVLPGEQLQITCKYDTRKRPNTKFGLETTDEMCMDFAQYWPVQRDPVTNEKINVCAYFEDFENNVVSTLCGDLGNLTNQAFIPEQNPAFNDTIGAPTDFGKAVPTCSARQPLTPSETSSAVVTTVSPETADPSPVVTAGATIDSATTETEGENGESGDVDDDDNDGGNDDDDDDDDDDVCFPASATVMLRDGSKKRMDELQIGDSVLVGREEYSDVFLFTHRTSGVVYGFVQLTTSSGSSVRLTRGHFLYLNGKLTMAGSARVGDEVIAESGKTERVTKVKMVMDKGLFNPQTIHGDIVVDGIVSSTYTHTISPMVAHGLLAPLRVLHKCLGALGLVSSNA